MMRIAEGLVFVSLAMGLHVSLFGAAPYSLGGPPQASQGQSDITVTAAAPAQKALARDWTKAPDLARGIAQPDALQMPTTIPQPPRPEQTARTLPAPMQLAQPDLPALPDRPSAPPPEPATQDQPAPDTRPQARPPRPKAAQAAPPRPARQKASAGANAPPAANTAQTQAAQAEWGAQIQRKVHRRLSYPRSGSGSGAVQVALTVTRAGQLANVQITGSSGIAAFDGAALQAVRNAANFPPAPAALRQPSYRFTLALAFRP